MSLAFDLVVSGPQSPTVSDDRLVVGVVIGIGIGIGIGISFAVVVAILCYYLYWRAKRRMGNIYNNVMNDVNLFVLCMYLAMQNISKRIMDTRIRRLLAAC